MPIYQMSQQDMDDLIAYVKVLEFDLDPASCPRELSAVPARRIYTIEDDGLSLPWEGRVWMNPPYSKPTPWVDRFIEHGHGIALLPVANNARWMARLWSDAAGVALWSDALFNRADGTKNCWGHVKDGENWQAIDGQEWKVPQGRWPANVILTCPEDEYILRDNVTQEEKTELYHWLQENA